MGRSLLISLALHACAGAGLWLAAAGDGAPPERSVPELTVHFDDNGETRSSFEPPPPPPAPLPAPDPPLLAPEEPETEVPEFLMETVEAEAPPLLPQRLVAIPRAPRPPPAHAPTPPEAPPAEPAPPRAATLTPPRPSATRCAAPDYPESARREGAQGRVVLRLRISAAGRVLAAEVAKSSGWRSLDAAALAAVARWEFIPALEDGRPVPFAVLVPVNFALEE